MSLDTSHSPEVQAAQDRISLAHASVRHMTLHQIDEGLTMIAYVLPHRDGLEEYTLHRVQEAFLDEIARRINSQTSPTLGSP